MRLANPLQKTRDGTVKVHSGPLGVTKKSASAPWAMRPFAERVGNKLLLEPLRTSLSAALSRLVGGGKPSTTSAIGGTQVGGPLLCQAPGVLLSPEAARDSGRKLTWGEVDQVTKTILENHTAADTIDSDTLTERIVEQFIGAFDHAHALLLEGDVNRLRRILPRVLESTRQGDSGDLEREVAAILALAQDREAYVRKLLESDFELDESVELVVDPRRRGYPTTPDDRRARIREIVHYQMASLVGAGAELDAAKKTVIHNLERSGEKLMERLAPGGLPTLYTKLTATSLDPHSEFLTAAELKKFKAGMGVSIAGIGVTVQIGRGSVRIESVKGGGPADKNKICRGDEVVAIAQGDDAPLRVNGVHPTEILDLLRGEVGSKVTLTLKRRGVDSSFDVTVVRGEVEIQAAKLRYETVAREDRSFKIGILELPVFYGKDVNGRSAFTDVKALLQEAKTNRVDGLVLDLSRNPGGDTFAAVQIAGLFMRQASIAAFTDPNGSYALASEASCEGRFFKPLAVLVSPASASASELVAGALRDYGRAIIVGGGRTFGKGTSQLIADLPKGIGATKLTNSMYFLPSGASPQHQGVSADVVIPTTLGYLNPKESDLEYALPPMRMQPFMSAEANGSGDEHWEPITSDTISELEANSKARLAQDEQMSKLRCRLAKLELPDTVSLERLISEKGGAEDRQPVGIDEHPRLVAEASEVLSDLIEMQLT